MNNREIASNNKKKSSSGKGLEIAGSLIEYLLALIVIVLCIALAFYTQNGYIQIGDAKFTAYRNIMMIGSIILLAVLVPYMVLWLKEHRKLQVSATDICVLIYLILSSISAFVGGFYEDAIWGYNGWNMGLMSQISFVLLYILLSRFGRYYRMILIVLCTAASVVYIIGILNRLLIDPLGFYDGLTNIQKTLFLSTLGQATWYGSFLAVTLPIGMEMFIYADGKVWRILSGVFIMLGFCTLVTQNSDSAYFALAGTLLVFFMISAVDQEKMCCFTGMLTLFFMAGKIMYYLMQIRPNPEFEADYVTKLMWTSRATWVMFVGCLAATIILYIVGRKSKSPKYPEALMRRLCQIVPVAAIITMGGIVLLIILQAKGILPKAIADGLSDISYLQWDKEWGNGRGRIWSFSLKMYAEADIKHKLFGVGPDCFHSYADVYYSAEQALFWGETQLTNAHNEWLNSLINVGIMGTVSYIGIYVTAIRRCFHAQGKNILLPGISAACVSYVCYNFFCYQQVLCTPFIFLLMGVGEYMLREAD